MIMYVLLLLLLRLGTNYVDSLVLHSPLNTAEKTQAAWEAMEELKLQGKLLGGKSQACCCTESVLCGQWLRYGVHQCKFAAYSQQQHDVVRLMQSMCISDSPWLRQWCSDNHIVYQSFWSLTANPGLLHSPLVKGLARKYARSSPQILFKYLTERGIVPLTGTCDPVHMKEDLEVLEDENFVLEDSELSDIDHLIQQVCLCVVLLISIRMFANPRLLIVYFPPFRLAIPQISNSGHWLRIAVDRR
eukprot:jgi/Bigna1/66226/fgenesh1_pg.1_\